MSKPVRGISLMIPRLGVFIRHEPNRTSGGKISNIEIGTFLSQPGQGPEKQELLRLIGTLVTGSWEVGPEVGNVRNNRPELMERVAVREAH